ncbi:uncharacterized protein LOC109810290 [Cajanus cajan]|uniref:uncharacterized protein LOC109810290 n=1 Tax=Cajanus cajan TaxID=3821 RepID=UPI00098D7ECE|nr:uncharacterized protein LOC109810290 [Cajanus cajan]
MRDSGETASELVDAFMEEPEEIPTTCKNSSKSYMESLLSPDGGKIFTDLNSLMKEMEEFEEWCSPWRNSLVINVLGKRVAYKMLDNKVQREWAKSGIVRLVDLTQDYYLVQFSSEDDYKHALYEGPWMIADHYIVVQRWRPFFTLTTSQTRKIAAWVRIPGLPIELFNDRFLWRVGSKLGTMLKIDKLTSVQTRGRFARICVEIDLKKNWYRI